jgi:Ca2+-transporting ATPase
LLIDQFSSIVVYLLAVAAAVAWLTGSRLEASAIMTVLIINAAIGFLIEWQAERALDALKKASKTMARVRRNSSEKVINAENLVPGDIIIPSAGDMVPADSRILESASLRIDESTLTGESIPVEKNSDPVEINAPLVLRRPMLYLGTTVVAGIATAIVTATGSRTELGRIGQMVDEAGEGQTPLQRRLADLGKRLVYIVLAIALLVLLAGVLRGDNIWLMLQVAVSLAVAAVPEGLPAVTPP